MHIALPLAAILVAGMPAASVSAQAVATRVVPADGAMRVRDSATALIARFLELRRAAWRASELKRHKVPYGGTSTPGFGGNVRLQRMHCHGDYGIQGVEIESRSRLRVCPGFPPARADTIPGDEARDADAGMIPAQRDSVRRSRARLLDALASLAALESRLGEVPEDTWLLAQRVRFAVDQADTAAARALVARCADGDWRCLMLRGHVEHHLVGLARAESTFISMLAAMPPDERCRWIDIEPLLDGQAARARYRALPCAARAPDERRFWWLADPLIGEPGNDRWEAHMARRATVALRSAVAQDDRMHWKPEYGGDAMAQLVVRYGWPAYFWWGGEAEDASHHDWARQPEHHWGIPPNATFWSAEYPVTRLQLAPSEAQLASPFDALAWSPADIVAPVAHPLRWKPREHYAPATPIAPLADVQVALLRRAEGTLVVAATDPAAVVGRRLLVPEGDSMIAALVHTTGPDSVATIAERRVAAGERFVLMGLVRASGPALVALELRPARTGGAARTPRRRARTGVTLPPPLSALARGDVGISVPVLMDASDADTARETVDALSRRMLGGAVASDRSRIALYWETYGFAPSDTLDVTLRVTRLDRGVLSRVAGALRLPGFRSEGRDGAAVRWTESPRGAAAVQDIPVRAWVRNLDLRTLPPGRYEVAVAVARGDGPAADSRRAFTIAR